MNVSINRMRLLLARIDQIIETDGSPTEIRQQIKQAFFDASYDAPSLGTFTMRIVHDNGRTQTLDGWPHRALINVAINVVQEPSVMEVSFVRNVDRQCRVEEG